MIFSRYVDLIPAHAEFSLNSHQEGYQRLNNAIVPARRLAVATEKKKFLGTLNRGHFG
jgi:hypothetical protein